MKQTAPTPPIDAIADALAITLDTLPAIRAAGVAAPAYARADLTPGILHFGVGNFHRAHQAVYLDALMNTGEGRDFAIIGVGTRPGDNAVRDALQGQDWLTTVVEQSATQSSPRITGAMVDMIAPGETTTILERLADPAIRIVSLTITEGGYYVDARTDRFDPTHPEIAADASNLEAPSTVFGLIVAGLAARREAGTPPFTVMSCDNLPHNGAAARNAVTGLARLADADLARWIEDHVSFPNGMVDRITPATSDREREMVARDHGLADAWPVFCEDFVQWVLEDDFCAGRPPLETVGVQFVDDVAPFEAMKLRILNGGHAIIAYPAGLLDIHFVHEAMANPHIAGFLAHIERDEIVPHVPPVPDTDLLDYLASIQTRFANPKIGDTVRRLCFDGSNRQPKFILPALRERLEATGEAPGLALVSALWCRYCYGETESGAPIAPNDPDWDRLHATARAARTDPAAWLGLRDVYGDLGADPRFAGAFAAALDSLWRDGTAATLGAYCGRD